MGNIRSNTPFRKIKIFKRLKKPLFWKIYAYDDYKIKKSLQNTFRGPPGPTLVGPILVPTRYTSRITTITTITTITRKKNRIRNTFRGPSRGLYIEDRGWQAALTALLSTIYEERRSRAHHVYIDDYDDYENYDDYEDYDDYKKKKPPMERRNL